MSGFGGPVSRKSEQNRIFAFSKRGERTGFDDKFRLGGADQPSRQPATASETFALIGHPRMPFPPGTEGTSLTSAVSRSALAF
jgi:hypothetical protein